MSHNTKYIFNNTIYSTK